MKIYAAATAARLVILMGLLFVTANAWSQVQGHHAGLHNTVQTLTLPTTHFTYGGCTISLNWAAD